MHKDKNNSFLALNLFIFCSIFTISYNVFSFHDVSADTEEYGKVVYKTAWKTINEKFYFKNHDLKMWENKFDSKIRNSTDAHKYINKFIEKLHDPYTKFLSKEQLQTERDIINSKLVGIGIKIADTSPIVVNVLPNSPADRAGIITKDIILTINNCNTRNLSNASITKLLKGQKGSEVNIEIKRKNDTFKRVILREEIKINPIVSKLLDENIGFIRIETFISDNTAELFKKELNLLMPTNGLIIDLRNNTGGLFKNAIEIADSLLSEGKIISTITQKSILNEYANSKKIYDGKIIVLVNKDTASASEILTTALKENDKCVVIGGQTFGKGLVQEVIELPDRSGLHITIAEYLSPNGKKINKVGIKPDICINNETEQIKSAIKILKNGYMTINI